MEFGAIQVVGLGIGLLCLWISHYVLGFTSLVADNISSNIIRVGIATAFRFLVYRFWVCGPAPARTASPLAGTARRSWPRHRSQAVPRQR